MRLGTKDFAKPFAPLTEISKEEKDLVIKIINKDVEDVYTFIVEDSGVLFTLGYYANCRTDKIPELVSLANALERP